MANAQTMQLVTLGFDQEDVNRNILHHYAFAIQKGIRHPVVFDLDLRDKNARTIALNSVHESDIEQMLQAEKVVGGVPLATLHASPAVAAKWLEKIDESVSRQLCELSSDSREYYVIDVSRNTVTFTTRHPED